MLEAAPDINKSLNAALVRKFPPAHLLRTALLVQLGLALVLLGVVATGVLGPVGLVSGLWLVLSAQGMIPANASVLALHDYGHMAGTAAAVIGALQSAGRFFVTAMRIDGTTAMHEYRSKGIAAAVERTARDCGKKA